MTAPQSSGVAAGGVRLLGGVARRRSWQQSPSQGTTERFQGGWQGQAPADVCMAFAMMGNTGCTSGGALLIMFLERAFRG